MNVVRHVMAQAATVARVGGELARVLAFAFVAKSAPAEIQLWNVGDNPTDYGVHRWTERSAREVLEVYGQRGNPLLIDVEHNGAKVADGEPACTGGYCKLELRNGAPWLVFSWSAYALEQIATGQRLFLSPEYDVDRETGEIVRLYRVSLVADPGTHRARMLASSGNEQEKNPMDLKLILAALRAALAAEDPAVAKESIQALLTELDKSAGGDAPAEAAAPPADGDQAAPAAAAAPGDGPPPDVADKDHDKMSAASASAKKAVAVAAASPAASASAVEEAARDAVQTVQDATRDHLLATQGDRLDPSIRRWASSQPLQVVRGLLNAAPAKDLPPARVSATRGEGQGAGEPRGLQGAEAEELDRLMGGVKASAVMPYRDAKTGALVIPSATPTEIRNHLAAVAAGKAGK